MAYLAHRLLGTPPLLGPGTDLAAAALGAVLLAGSRDAPSKYRDRVRQPAARDETTTPEGEVMTNGIDHHQGGSGSPKPPAPKATRRQAPAQPKAPDAKAAPPPPGAK